MKKYILSAVILLTGILSYAQTSVEFYAPKISILGGLAIPTTDADKNIGLGYGSSGGSLIFQVMPMVTDVLNLGLEGGFNFYSSDSVYKSGITYTAETNDKFLFLAGTVKLPQTDKQPRIYIPFGVGLMNTDVDVTYRAGAISTHDDFKDTSAACYLGLGFGFQINKGFAFGLEARHTWNELEDKGIKSKHNLLSLLIKLSFDINSPKDYKEESPYYNRYRNY